MNIKVLSTSDTLHRRLCEIFLAAALYSIAVNFIGIFENNNEQIGKTTIKTNDKDFFTKVSKTTINLINIECRSGN